MKHMITIFTLVLIAGFSRLIPHPWNFTAVGAMALFSGARMPNKWMAFVAPLLSLLWTDAVIGFHSTAIYVYAAVALITIIGFFSQNNYTKVAIGTLLGSVLFFLITNFGVWAAQDLYPMTLKGLSRCYAMAIPFFGNQILGDAIYTAALFGVYAAITSSEPFLNHAE
jgi:hypothetical protein